MTLSPIRVRTFVRLNMNVKGQMFISFRIMNLPREQFQELDHLQCAVFLNKYEVFELLFIFFSSLRVCLNQWRTDKEELAENQLLLLVNWERMVQTPFTPYSPFTCTLTSRRERSCSLKAQTSPKEPASWRGAQ